MFELLAILIRFSLIFFFLLPVVLHFLDKDTRDFLEVFILTVGSSLGLGSYFLFLVYLANGKFVTQSSSFLFFFLVFFLSFLAFRKECLAFIMEKIGRAKRFLFGLKIKNIFIFFFNSPAGIIRFLITILIIYAFLLSPFFPISQWDDLVRYAAWGNSIFTLGEIRQEINSYPLLVPLLYAYGFIASGFRNDYLIKMIPFIFGILTLILAYLMANVFFKKREYRGLLAVFFTLCFVPFFDWMHLGYVDITSSFYFAGSFYYFYLYSKNGNKNNLIFLGLFLGLSLWSKQQTLTILVSLFLSTLLILINQKKMFLDSIPKIKLKEIFISLAIPLVIIFPWYLRDFILVGTPIQIPLFESSPDIKMLFPFIKEWQSVGYYSSAFFQIAIFYVLINFFISAKTGLNFKRKYLQAIGVLLILFSFLPITFEGHPAFNLRFIFYQKMSLFLGFTTLLYSLHFPESVIFRLRTVLTLLIIWILPFYLFWWFKYTAVFRYLITIIPLLVLLFVFVFDEVFPILSKKFKYNKISSLFICLLLISFVSPRLSDALAGKGLSYFFANEQIKGVKTVDDSYIVGEYLNRLNISGRPKIISTDNRLAYYAPKMSFHNITPAYLSDLVGFDYYILNPWTKEAYDLRKKDNQEVYYNLINENPTVFKKIYEHTPYKIYQIVLANSDFKTQNLLADEVRKKIEVSKTIESENIEKVNSLKYFLGRLKDRGEIILDKIFYNRPKEINIIINSRLTEAEKVCLSKETCFLAVKPLEEVEDLLQKLDHISTENRLLIDENFYLFGEMRDNFPNWGAILLKISEKSSPASSLADELLKNSFYPLVDKFDNNINRREPKFSYYDKKGELTKR